MSDALLTSQARFPWVFQMIANQAEGDRKLAVSDAFPELAPEACTAKLQEVQKWLKSLPFASRPLVKVIRLLTPASRCAVDAHHLMHRSLVGPGYNIQQQESAIDFSLRFKSDSQ